jgi:hypothetical protein
VRKGSPAADLSTARLQGWTRSAKPRSVPSKIGLTSTRICKSFPQAVVVPYTFSKGFAASYRGKPLGTAIAMPDGSL